MSETETFTYAMKSEDMDFTIELIFNKKDFSLVNLNSSTQNWTRLDFHKCSHCTLNTEQFPFCPLASALDNIISKVHSFLSYDEVHAQVEYKNRVVSSDVTVQRALSSILGLIIPASGCPHTKFFRPMARFHQPFADTEETIYRATTMFLLAQYFIHKKNGCIPPDFTRLQSIYNNVHKVNTQLCKRLREFCESDSPLNAIIILDMLTVSINSAIKHDLEKFEAYFSAYSEDFAAP